MAETPVPSIGDLLGLIVGANPLPQLGKTIDQFRRGVNEFLGALDNFNRTMKTLNDLADRAVVLFDEIEDPIRAAVPQVTRAILAADTVINQISGPMERVAPGLSRLADTLSNPVFVTMPDQIASFLETFADVARRLQPLSQMAENAGSMFNLRGPLAAFLGGSSSNPAPPAPTAPPPANQPPAPTFASPAQPIEAGLAGPPAARPSKPVPEKAIPEKAIPEKAVAKKAVAKKAVAKKATATKAAAKKAATKKAATKKAATEKSVAGKSVARNAAATTGQDTSAD